MDTGKIFLGIALIACSVAMVINPASAAMGDSSCLVGNGNLHIADCRKTAGLSQDLDSTAHSPMTAINLINPGNLP
ncbi:MAG: hypothetical protein WC620_09790 [Methanoregula sp.]|jgi:hypothetical protein